MSSRSGLQLHPKLTLKLCLLILCALKSMRNIPETCTKPTENPHLDFYEVVN